MARGEAWEAAGFAQGDRVLFLGLGRRGKQADVLAVRRATSLIRFDDGVAMLCLTADLHPVPRRPPPMW